MRPAHRNRGNRPAVRAPWPRVSPFPRLRSWEREKFLHARTWTRLARVEASLQTLRFQQCRGGWRAAAVLAFPDHHRRSLAALLIPFATARQTHAARGGTP